jgi:hypothetical protein
MKPLTPYVVTIDNTHKVELFAKDRDDAITFVKRNNQARFFNKTYKKITSARAQSQVRQVRVRHAPDQAP